MLGNVFPTDQNTSASNPGAQDGLRETNTNHSSVLQNSELSVFVPGYGIFSPTFKHPDLISISLQPDSSEALPLTADHVLADVQMDWKDGSQCRFSQLPLTRREEIVAEENPLLVAA